MLTRIKKLLYLISLFFDKRSPWYFKLLIIAGFIYLIVPFDLIADNIPILGLLDDIGVLSLIGWAAYGLLPVEMQELVQNRFKNKKT